MRPIQELNRDNRCLSIMLFLFHLNSFIICRHYNAVHHNDSSKDTSYFQYWDNRKQRYIYVSRKEVGRSRVFNEQKHVDYFLDLVGSDDIHWYDLTPRERQKLHDSFIDVALQLECCDGNVSIFCDRGRSRSPAYLAAYLVMGLGHTAFQSYRVLSLVFVENRDDSRGIDRDRRFYIYVKWIQQRVLKTTDALIDISEVWLL